MRAPSDAAPDAPPEPVQGRRQDVPAPGPPPAPSAAHEIPYTAELSRKGLHLLSLVVPLTMALIGRTWSLYLLVPAALFALACDALRVRSTVFARAIDRLFGFMMRPDERPPVGGPVVVNGATWVLVSAALLALFFPLRVAIPAFVMFMIADAAAALVGRRYGRRRWPASTRTFEGSGAFVAVGVLTTAAMSGSVAAFAPATLVPPVALWIGAVSVFVGAFAEVVPRPFNDNIRVPIASAVAIVVLEYLATGRVPAWPF